jgi:hypothetical protein
MAKSLIKQPNKQPINVVVNMPKQKSNDAAVANMKKKIQQQKSQLKMQAGYKQLKVVGAAVARTLRQTNRLSPQQLQAYRQAKAARLQAIRQQSTQAYQQTGWDNKFERQLIERKARIDDEERRRRFTEVPKDFLLRRDAIRQQQMVNAKEYGLRNSLLKAHESQFKVNLNLLGCDPVCNLAKSPPIWRQDNPDNNVFRDNGRPTILDAPNRFAVTPQTQQMNILNAERLNFGNVDTTRKPRKNTYRPQDDF